MKKWLNKQTITVAIVFAILFSSVGVFAELVVNPNTFPVLIDGISANVDAYNINGFTYLKLGDMRQTGLKVVFNETDLQIEITSMATPTNTSSDTTTPPTTTAPETTIVQEPVTPDYDGYNAACARLDAACTAANNALWEAWNNAYKMYPPDSVTKEAAYNSMQANCAANNAKLATDKEALKAQYNIP